VKKWIIIGGVLAVIIFVVLVIGLSQLGSMVKHAVNTYGPKMTKTEVRVSQVGISLFSGQAKLKNFVLGNPKGYKAVQAMKVGSIYVDVDEGSITGATVIVEKIEMLRPEINYERRRGTDNFRTILNNVSSSADAGKGSRKQSDKEGDGKKLLIRNFIVKEGRVSLDVSEAGGKRLTASALLPHIHLKDLGKKKGGASPAEVFDEVLAALYKTITSADVSAALNKQLKAVASGVEETADKNSNKDLEAVTEKVKGFSGK
jgi:uncharacterized protein involved in outer membrane biogenesis